MHYTLKATEAGLSKGIITSEERTQTVVLTVSPKQIYKPVFDTTVQYFYNGGEQQVKFIYNELNTGNKSDIEALYTVTGDKGTYAGDYTAVVSLVDKANYSWVIAPTQFDGTTGTMNSDHNFKWTIQKVNLGAEYEPTNIVRFYPQDNVAYFGQTASAIPFLNTSYAKYTDYTGRLVDVPGTFAWKNPAEVLVNDSRYPASYAPTLTAVFTPDDTDNFEVLERGKTPVVQQLFVTVTQVKPDGTEEIVKLPVGYGSSVDFAIQDERAGTHQDKESVTVNSTAVTGGSSAATVFEGFNGYTAGVYRTRTVGGLTNKIESTDAILKNITENVNIYIGYTAEYVGYTVYHVKQHPNGAYATEENIVQGTTSSDFATMLVEREIYAENPVGTEIATDKKTGDRFSPLGKVKSYDGFAYNNDKTAQTVTVAGDGSTNVFIYYARQQYTVTFTARGSNVTTQTKKFYFEQELDLTGIVEPTKLNTTFAGWYYDDAYTQRVTFAGNSLGQPADTMGGANMSLYAKFEAKTYKVIFDMNASASGEQYTINTGNILGDEIVWAINNLFPSDSFTWRATAIGYEVEYSIDNLTSNKNLSLIAPTALGYSFAGWYNGSTRTTSLRVPNSSTQDEITLVAHWNPGTFTMSFNTRGGSTISAKTVTNFSTWESILPQAPTRFGYEFVTWCPSEEEANYGVDENGPLGQTIYDVGDDETLFNVKGFGEYYKVGNGYNVSTITLYALWDSCDNYLVLGPNVSGNNPYGTLTFKRGSEGITPGTGAVKIGDVITVECTPTNGYAFKNLKINGSPLSNGVLQFTVGEYDSNEITVDADFTEVNYTIAYDTNGGRSGDSSVTRRYTINTAKVVLPSLMTKTGYTFAGWYYEGTNIIASKTVNGELLLDKTSSTTGDLSLVAKWEANEAHIFLYNAKYDGTVYDNMGEYYEVSEYGDGAIVTDMTVRISNPNRGSSLVFMGWALTRGGAVVYPATPGESSVEYSVSPAYDASDKNTSVDANKLYAIWSIANLDYVIMSASNNGTTYGGAGITVTARPSTDYEDTYGANITLAYTWYKVLDEDKVFELKEADNIFVDKDGNIVDDDYDGEKFHFTYKVLSSDFTDGCSAGIKVEPFAPNGDNSISMQPITDVNDSGTYLCVLVVTGNVAGSSSATAFGEIKVEIQKAEYRNAVVKNVNLTYNYDDLKDDAIRAAVTLADGANGLSADKRTLELPDGSIVNITYTFANASGTVESVKDAGVYTLTAHFEFAEGGDKGNYVLPEDIDAELTVTPKSLGNIKYSMMQGEDVISTEDYAADYNGKAYSVVAEILDTIGITSTPVTEIDDVKVQLEVYKVSSSGASKVEGETVDAGSYYVMIVGLVDGDGNEVTNYQIGGSVARQCRYTINKAKHDISGLSFEDLKVAFDNELHEIAIQGELPEGVSVKYETQFYADDPDFVTSMHRLNNFNETNNAGRYAGVYT
ncbi:MAG: InlB B-repeat-containing protein, partial [Clostridia bacterium]|nr:InlB B-repeat-containing protein [Clostridia bacterium]